MNYSACRKLIGYDCDDFTVQNIMKYVINAESKYGYRMNITYDNLNIEYEKETGRIYTFIETVKDGTKLGELELKTVELVFMFEMEQIAYHYTYKHSDTDSFEVVAVFNFAEGNIHSIYINCRKNGAKYACAHDSVMLWEIKEQSELVKFHSVRGIYVDERLINFIKSRIDKKSIQCVRRHQLRLIQKANTYIKLYENLFL